MELILASNSPRRRYLLDLLGWDFRVIPADVDESLVPDESPSKYVLRLVESKARAVGAQVSADAVVVAADTTVVDGNEILGKPVDSADAEQMLRQLRGRVHQVCTAVAVMRAADGVLLTDVCVTDVPMRDYNDTDMLAYIASGDPLDKAGAYAIQHAGFHPAENLQGCYANVVGLPLCHLARIFRKLGYPSGTDLPQVCQAVFGYQCNL
ncbi:MAG: septum formation protein Maf [Chloroflexi bacterium]|nr:septum formation protein Maf [Chloroflexota bacterium]MBU1661542.1 septum formation protein Maf [Chloroflexota bacterium]